jgi:hypothetical protein
LLESVDSLQSGSFTSAFPGKFDIITSEMPAGGGLLIDRLAQARVADDRAGVQVEELVDEQARTRVVSRSWIDGN